MAISKEKLLKGKNYTEEFYLNDEDFIVLRLLSSAEFNDLYKKYEKDETALNNALISKSLVEPVLTEEEVGDLALQDLMKIVKRILAMNGMDIDTNNIQEQVEQFRQN